LDATPKTQQEERAHREPSKDDRIREEESKEGAAQGGYGADLQTHGVGVADVALVENVREVLQGETAAELLEAPDEN
jgi:hypothetical protein